MWLASRLNPAIIKPLFVFYILLMLALTLSPSLNELPSANHLDKLYHAVGFTLFALLYRLAYPKLAVWMTFVVGLILGMGIEIAQLYVPGRSFDWWDWVADVVGLLVGRIALIYLNNK